MSPAAVEHFRAELLSSLEHARAESDAIFAMLAPEAFYERPVAERHRLVFYLGHLDAFDWNLLVRDGTGRPPRSAALEKLFAFGIDPIAGDLPTDIPSDWPSPDAIREWVSLLRADVDALVEQAPLVGATGASASAPHPEWFEDGWAIRLAIEHRLMHVETLAYLIHRIPRSLRSQGTTSTPSAPAPAIVSPRTVEIPEGNTVLGLDRSLAPRLGWDNEYEAFETFVPAFNIDVYKTTNAEFLHFVEAGGYRKPTFWTPEGWAWRERIGLEHPSFWKKRGTEWLQTAMFEDVPLPPTWPVYVTHAEASAYAKWRGALLPSEAEWQRAAFGPSESPRAFPWGNERPEPGVHGNFGFAHWDPTPIGAHPSGRSAFGVDELIGNGWEWTRTPFAPFVGFAPLPFYPGYSENFFDGKHYVLKGASPRTALPFLRRSFRNWFQPHYPYVYATFRCALAEPQRQP